MKKIIHFSLLFMIVFGLVTCNWAPEKNTKPLAVEDNKFRIWWQQGFYPEETEAIQTIVDQWQKANGKEVELSLLSDKDIIAQTESAIKTGKLPDILYNPSIDLSLIPKLAGNNQLADVSEVLEPIKNRYVPAALEAVKYQNTKTKRRSYYAIPIQQQTANIHYWKDSLAEININDQKIPDSWQDFWQFWKMAQEKLRKKGLKDIYAMGLPMSPLATTDTSFIFEQFLEAYDVELVNKDGQLLFEDPKVREGIIKALTEYTSFFQKGFVPPEARQWSNPDNNVSFLSHNSLMTINPSLSIPGSQRQDKDTYNKIGSTLWPLKVNGEKTLYLAGFKQIILFESSTHKEEAKDFFSYLLKPENLGNYLKKSQGRYSPVMIDLLNEPFWNDPKDNNIFVATQQSKSTRPFPQVYNAAYTEVLADNVWGEAIQNVIENKKSPEQSTDEAIQKIKGIFAQML